MIDEGATILSTKELAAWPQDDVATLKRLRLLKKAAPTKVIECPGCEEACLMPVNVYPAQDDRPARIFIACDKRDDTGRIPIDPVNLEQWQIDAGRFAYMLEVALGTGHDPVEIVPHQAFYLGPLTINRKRRSAIFISNNETLEYSLEAGLFEQYPRPFFLVSNLNRPQEMKQGPAIPLPRILVFSRNSLSLDMEELNETLSARARQDFKPVEVPSGTDWKQVFISFVNDQTVQIRVAGKTEYRSFDELGFNDVRKNDNQPLILWGIFRQLATLHGEMSFQDSVESFNEPEKVKKWVSLIRKKLKEVFPSIPNDPFYPYNQARGYKTRFLLSYPTQNELR